MSQFYQQNYNREKAEKIYKEGYSLYLEKQDFNGAIKLFDQSLIYNPEHQLSQCVKGNALSKMGQYKESIIWYDQCIGDAIQRVIDKAQAIELNVDSIFNKGEALLRIGEEEQAIEQFDKALTIDPNNVNSLFGKGGALLMLGQQEESIEWFDKVLEIDPINVNSLWGKGKALLEMGQKKESIEWFDKALAIDPKHVPSLGNKGESLNEIGKYQEALNLLSQALELAPSCLWISNEIKISKEKLKK